MAILKIKDKGVWKEIQAIKGDTGHDVYVGDKSKAPSEAKLIIEPVNGTATGTDIQVTDSANDRVSKLVLDGKSTQETRSGKNILNFDAVLKYWNAIYTSSDNVYSLTDVSSMYRNPYALDLEVGKNYTFSIQGATQNSTNLKLEILKDGTVIQFISAINGGSKTFEVESGSTYTLRGNYATREYPVIFNKPMLRLSTTDDTYEQYGASPSPDYPSEIENIKGKNLLPNNATSQTTNGVTFTVNNDKTILVNGNNDGTASSSFIIKYYSLKAGTYILNGCPSGGSSTTYRIAIQKTSDWSVLGLDTGSGSKQFTIDEATNVQVAIVIQKGQTISNLLFKPMIRLSSIIDDTYVPYENIQIVETGKNIAKFDRSKNTNINSWIYTSNVANNITATKKGTGDSFYATFVANVVKGEQYVFSTSTSNHISMYCYSDKLWGDCY